MQKITAPQAHSPLPWLCCCLALLSGCAPLEWQKSGASDEARDKDAAECAAQARAESLKRVPMLYPHTPGLPTGQARAYPSQDNRLDSERFMIEQDALRTCMHLRGYELQKQQNSEP